MDDVLQIKDLISDIKVAMLTTKASNGQLHSRPMATQKIDHQGKLWFFTSISSLKSIEISNEKNINITYAKPDCYVSITGRAEITQDPIKVHALWEPRYEAWFPLGLEDEELALLRVDIDFAEYWVSPNGAVTRFMDFAKNLVIGEKTDNNEGHGKVVLSEPGGFYAQN